MSQIIDFCENSSDNNGEWPKTRKRSRDEDEPTPDANPRNENGPGIKNTTGSADFFVVDLELADKLEVSLSPQKMRRSVMQVERSAARNDVAGKYAPILKGVHAMERDVAQIADHRESQEGIAAVASLQMNSDSEQTSRDDESANEHSQKPSASKPPSIASGRQRRVSSWEDRLSELTNYREVHGHCNVREKCSENTKLAKWVDNQRNGKKLLVKGKRSSMTADRIHKLESLGFAWGTFIVAWEDRLSELTDYRKFHGHCNVPRSYSDNTQLGEWVVTQRKQYRLHVNGKKSHMTLSRIEALESLAFEWKVCVTAWEDRLSELADYRKIHGHCNVPKGNGNNTQLGEWVVTQRRQYRLHVDGKKSHMTFSHIEALESLAFEWKVCVTAWEDRLSELGDYRKIHGHCKVPFTYPENTKLGTWVSNQRTHYRLHLEGKKSSMTLSRIQALESFGFEWNRNGTTRENCCSELANNLKIHGHCNVPYNYSENIKLGKWANTQRCQYRLHVEGKKSSMTLLRIQALESLGFEWKPISRRRKGNPKNPSLDEDATRARERAVDGPEHLQQHSLKTLSVVEKSTAIKSTSHSNPKNPTGMATSTSIPYRVEPQNSRRVDAGDARFDETDLDGAHSELAAKPSLSRNRQAAKSLSPDKSTPPGDSVESNNRKDALYPRLPVPPHQQKSINSLSHAVLLVAGPPENDRLVAAKKPANSTHTLLPVDESTGNGVQATPEKWANVPPDRQHTPPDQSAQVLADRRGSHKGNPCAFAPARANPAAIAAIPATANSIVDTKETKMVCKVIKREQDGEQDKIIGFFILKSHTKSFVDARQAMLDQGVPIHHMDNYRFYAPHLGPVAVQQESTLGPMLAFLERCTPRADTVGDGSYANPVKVLLMEAPFL